MVTRTLWLWLSIGCLTEAVITSSTTSLCDLGSPCKCTVGKLICDCSTSFLKEVLLKDSLLNIFSFSSISVTNCFHVHVASNALSGLSALQQVNVADVKQLTLEEKAFNWTTHDAHHTGLVINISNCNIQQIPSYSFRGYIRDILLSSVNISRINSFAFGSIDHAEKIVFNRINIIEIETQCFKKMSVEFLTVLDSSLGVLPERTMTDVTVHQEVRFDRVKISRMETSALKINSPRNFRLIKSTLGYLETNALDLKTKGDVSIHDNIFSHLERHAFAGVSVEEKYLKEAGKQDFVFENNTLIEFEKESLKLKTTSFDPRLDWIMLKQKCSCDNAKTWVDDLVVFSSNAFPKGKYPPVDKILFCLNTKPTSVADFQRLYCNVYKFSVFAIVVGVVVVIIAFSVIALVVYCGVKKRGKKYINVPTAASELRPHEVNKPHMLVVPDGKTYRETELHVIFEHADTIKTTNFRPDSETND